MATTARSAAPPTTSGRTSCLPDSRVGPTELDAALAELSATVELGAAGRRAADAVRAVVAAVASAVGPLTRIDHEVAEASNLRPWQRLIGDVADTPAGRQALHARLLWLHVATWTVADESPTEASYPVDLVQVSLQTRHPFAKYSTTVEDKVGGMSLHRFGGFLKRSWRMNDWTWGRIDAATMLCQIILSPERLRRRAIQHGGLQADDGARDGRPG